ncbi:MAG: isochorismatase [Conexibacter sp.]|jgi:nicotinamidase-related amidase|nr:isochorismatase [Conexibacter sp.]
MPQGPNTALIVVDVLNAYDHEDADRLVASVDVALPSMERLVRDARDRELLRIYVNDNFDDWTLDRGELLKRAMRGPHRRLVEPLAPDDDVPLVLKGRHSIFWETPLSYILQQAEVGRVVLCGEVTEQCILYSALDAHIRQFDVTIARDACAHIDEQLAEAALQMMERNMGARIAAAADALDGA